MTIVVHPGAKDPLSGMTPRQIWADCIKVSSERASVRSILHCIGQFMKADGTGSSMSKSQIAAETGLSVKTVERAIKDRIRDRWLRVEIQKGHLTRYGRENLHHALLPPSVVDKLREAKSRQRAARARKTKAQRVPVQPFSVINNPIEMWGQS